jgi:hypothetical protein
MQWLHETGQKENNTRKNITQTRHIHTTRVVGGAYPFVSPRSLPVFSGVVVDQYLVFCVMFLRVLFSFCPVSCSHCIVYPSIYCF